MSKLKTEILVTNPGTYAALTDQQVVDLLNLVDGSIKTNRTSMSSSEIFQNVVLADLLTLEGGTADDKAKAQRVWNVLAMGTVDPFGKESEVFVDAFGGGSATVTALAAARTTDISSAQDIGIPFPVALAHVIAARA